MDNRINEGDLHQSWRQTLLQAAEEVRKRGLAKGTQLADDGSVCIHGAINIARGELTPGLKHHADREPEINLAKYLKEVLGVEPYVGAEYGSAHWNNRPNTTAEDVIGALEGAALYGRGDTTDH